jgi:zinc/manganese transport system substrate-binding protein
MKHACRQLCALFFIAQIALPPAVAAAAAEPIPVVASFSILSDLVKVVGGDLVQITTLAGPDADAHEFAPSPTHAKALLSARLFVVNGLNFDPWAQKLAKSADYKGATLVASSGIQPRQMEVQTGHAETDPHAWQNPLNVALYVTNIANALAKIDPGKAATYRSNSDSYARQLREFDAQATAKFGAIDPAKRKVITSHDAFGYLGAHYGITLLAPEGISTDAQPSAKHVAELIRQIKREKIKAVFVENMSNPKLIEQLSRDTGVVLGATLYSDALSKPSGPAPTYLKMMQYNLSQLVKGMALN